MLSNHWLKSFFRAPFRCFRDPCTRDFDKIIFEYVAFLLRVFEIFWAIGDWRLAWESRTVSLLLKALAPSLHASTFFFFYCSHCVLVLHYLHLLLIKVLLLLLLLLRRGHRHHVFDVWRRSRKVRLVVAFRCALGTSLVAHRWFFFFVVFEREKVLDDALEMVCSIFLFGFQLQSVPFLVYFFIASSIHGNWIFWGRNDKGHHWPSFELGANHRHYFLPDPNVYFGSATRSQTRRRARYPFGSCWKPTENAACILGRLGHPWASKRAKQVGFCAVPLGTNTQCSQRTALHGRMHKTFACLVCRRREDDCDSYRANEQRTWHLNRISEFLMGN